METATRRRQNPSKNKRLNCVRYVPFATSSTRIATQKLYCDWKFRGILAEIESAKLDRSHHIFFSQFWICLKKSMLSLLASLLTLLSWTSLENPNSSWRTMVPPLRLAWWEQLAPSHRRRRWKMLPSASNWPAFPSISPSSEAAARRTAPRAQGLSVRTILSASLM